MFEDIYFLDANEALQVAAEQNRYGDNNIFLQICYYDGKKIESDLPNLVHIPIDNLLEGLAYGEYRLPTRISFGALDLSEAVKNDVKLSFRLSMQQVQMYREQFNACYLEESRNAKPDFKNEPLRFYLFADSSTQVMQYVARNIADALLEMGHDVKFELYMGIEDMGCFKSIAAYNPHVTININHFNNQHISKETFNFVWFQDAMDILFNDTPITVRQRDHVFALTYSLMELLEKKGVQSELMHFMTNEKIFRPRDEIVKKKKIVFIGSSYASRIQNISKEYDFYKVFEEARRLFEEKSCLRDTKHEQSEIGYLMEKYGKSKEYIGDIYAYLIRDYCVEKLCSISSGYEVEIYGHGWENNSVVAPFYRGAVQYGEELSKLYNGATYGFCPGGYILMQRTLECAFSGTIPLVLDVRADKQDVYDEKIEEALEFFHINDLQNMLMSEPKKKEFSFIKKHYGYKHFVNKCIEIIQKDIS